MMKRNIKTARALRRNSTEAERLLWSRLRSRRLAGLKFRRQAPIGRYIVDFLCIEKKVIVELDGGQHNWETRIDRDKNRHDWLESQGYKVLRFWNFEVYQDVQTVLNKIANECVIE